MLSIFKAIKKRFNILRNINFVNKSNYKIIFYSESKVYQKYSYDLIKSLSKKFPGQILYVSSEEEDKIMDINLKNLYIGKNFLMLYFFFIIKAENMILTLTDLDNHQIKKTKNIKNYIYYFHAPASTTKVYTDKAFDNYDTILCNGEYQINEIKKREKLKNLNKKKLIKSGYFYFDYLKNKINSQIISNEILIAPSWNYNQKNFINENLEFLIKKVLDKGYKVRFRPHPENLKRSSLYLKVLKNKFLDQQFYFDDHPENLNSMEKAKCLITDASGIAIEYLLMFKKPVLYLEDVDKIHNSEFSKYSDLVTMDQIIKDKFGLVFKKKDIDNIDIIITKALLEFKEKKKDIVIEKFINDNFYNYSETIKKFEENINEIL